MKKRTKLGQFDKVNETGNRYGRLVVIREAGRSGRRVLWFCKCDCGGSKVVRQDCLRNGTTKSCGCIRREIAVEIGLRQTGDRNPSYIDGIASGYNKNSQRDFHEKIRRRDNFTCQRCGKTQEQELIDAKRRLSVHHKDGDHFHNVDDNAVTTCSHCHPIVDHDRQCNAREQQRDASIIDVDDPEILNFNFSDYIIED